MAVVFLKLLKTFLNPLSKQKTRPQKFPVAAILENTFHGEAADRLREELKRDSLATKHSN